MVRFFVEWLPTVSQHLLFGALSVLAYILTTRARRDTRSPSTAIAWVMGLALLPYFVLPMYVMFGRRKLRPAALPRLRPPPTTLHWAAELIESFGLAAASHCQARLHADGAEARRALWEVIDSAAERLDVCTFIIGEDALGREAVERLAARARAGVRVRVLLDGFGAVTLPRRYFDTLRAAGGEVTVFRPFFGLDSGMGPRNLRNHRKYVIADDAVLWSGGRNLAAEYFTGDPDGRGAAAGVPWDDLSFDLTGPVATAAAHQFEQDWASVQRRRLRMVHPQPETAADFEAPEDMSPHGAPGGPGTHARAVAQFLPSGPDQPEDTAHALLLAACVRAKRRLLAVTPYFVPDDALRDALRLAARRGVEITIAIPARSNHRLTDFVRTRAMRDLARAGVVFRMLPRMAHAKAVVVDDTLAMCGSINLDLRSLLINHEAAVVFYSPRQIAWIARWIEALAATGALFRPRPPSLVRDIAEGLLLTVAFQL
jgi:cardiolipin synthase